MEHGKESFQYNLKDEDKVSLLAKALTSPTRLEILRMLLRSSKTMSELSQTLYVSMSSISMHTALLRDAGLITITPKPGKHGAKKLCGIRAERITIDLFEPDKEVVSPKIVSQDIPVGAYSHAEATRPCGLVSREGYIQREDESHCFYHPLHANAQLIWFLTGLLTYEISNRSLKAPSLEKVEISFEICAEAPGYNNTWPSDIFLKINNRHLTTFRVKGDYGGTRGVNNPAWWRDSNTQFGELTLLTITKEGTYLNNKRVSEENLDTLKMAENFYFSFTVGVDPKSEFPGGMNLFGKHFGNYSQDIRVKAIYE